MELIHDDPRPDPAGARPDAVPSRPIFECFRESADATLAAALLQAFLERACPTPEGERFEGFRLQL